MMIRTTLGNIYSKARSAGLLKNYVNVSSTSRLNKAKVIDFQTSKVSCQFSSGPFTSSPRSASVWSNRLSWNNVNVLGWKRDFINIRQLSTHCIPSRTANALEAGWAGLLFRSQPLNRVKHLCSGGLCQPESSFSTSSHAYAKLKKKKKRKPRDEDQEPLPFEVDTDNITRDYLVYSNEGSNRLFFVVSLFGLIQFGFWVYLAHFCHTTLIDTKANEGEKDGGEEASTLPFWRKINLGGNKYRFGLTVLCSAVGYLLLFISIVYPMRSVKYLHLLKGGQMARFTTYAPFGYTRSFTAKVDHIQSLQSRAEMKSQLSLKIKNRYMFFLMDSNGKFLNTQLFDYIVGMKRLW